VALEELAQGSTEQLLRAPDRYSDLVGREPLFDEDIHHGWSEDTRRLYAPAAATRNNSRLKDKSIASPSPASDRVAKSDQSTQPTPSKRLPGISVARSV